MDKLKTSEFYGEHHQNPCLLKTSKKTSTLLGVEKHCLFREGKNFVLC